MRLGICLCLHHLHMQQCIWESLPICFHLDYWYYGSPVGIWLPRLWFYVIMWLTGIRYFSGKPHNKTSRPIQNVQPIRTWFDCHVLSYTLCATVYILTVYSWSYWCAVSLSISLQYIVDSIDVLYHCLHHFSIL